MAQLKMRGLASTPAPSGINTGATNKDQDPSIETINTFKPGIIVIPDRFTKLKYWI